MYQSRLKSVKNGSAIVNTSLLNELKWKLIDTHAQLLRPVFMAMKVGLRCHMCDLVCSKFEEDRTKTAVAIATHALQTEPPLHRQQIH